METTQEEIKKTEFIKMDHHNITINIDPSKMQQAKFKEDKNWVLQIDSTVYNQIINTVYHAEPIKDYLAKHEFPEVKYPLKETKNGNFLLKISKRNRLTEKVKINVLVHDFEKNIVYVTLVCC